MKVWNEQRASREEIFEKMYIKIIVIIFSSSGGS